MVTAVVELAQVDVVGQFAPDVMGVPIPKLGTGVEIKTVATRNRKVR